MICNTRYLALDAHASYSDRNDGLITSLQDFHILDLVS
jgi:hypothetical protein